MVKCPQIKIKVKMGDNPFTLVSRALVRMKMSGVYKTRRMEFIRALSQVDDVGAAMDVLEAWVVLIDGRTGKSYKWFGRM